PDEIALSLRYADASGNRDVNIVENFQNVPEPGESEGDKKYTERDNWKYNIEVKDSTRITYSTVYQGFGKAFVPDDAVYKDKFTENGEGIISANITEAGTPADNGNAYIMPAVYYERLRYSLVFITNGGRMDGAPKPQIEQKDVYYEEPIEKYKGVVKELRPPEGMDGAEVRWYSTAGLVTGTEVDISDPSILMPVGGLTLYAKWMDPSYEVSFRTGSEDVVPTQYVPKGGYAEEPDPAPIRDGYELVGWREEGKNYFFKFTNPIHGDKVLDAVWKARSDASVILRHHKAGTTESVWPDQEFDDLQVHSSYTLFSIPKERYLPNLISYALLVEPGKNEHTFIYSPYVLAEYTVEYRPADPADAAAGDFPQAKKVTTENNVVTELPVEVEGFYPVKSVLTRPLASDPAENVLVFEYARIGAVPYTVKIYTQNDDLSGYSERPDLTVTLYAEPGKRVTVTPGDVPGYSVNLSLSGLSGVVSSDGGTEIKLYYDFSYYTVRYAAGGGTGVMADDRYVRHGSLYRVRPNGFTRDGYSFDGWRSDQGDVIMPGGTFTITGDRTLTAIWVSVGAGDGSTGGGEPPTDNGGDDGSTGGGSGDNGGGGGVSPTPPTTPTGPSGAGDGVIPSVPVVQIAPPATPAAPAQLPTLAPPSFVQPAPSETPSGGNAPAPSLPSGLNDAYDEFLRAIDEAGIPLITMGNMPVPLYGIPGQPVWALLNLILAALTLLLSIYTLLYFLFRRRRYENEDMQELGPYTLDVKEFRMFPGVLAILTGPLSILVFLLTEDMRFFMVIVDRWTLLMALLFVAEALFLANAGRDARVEQQGVAV
ncbi:MAG: InlB B-repeat-containing protein, partial [Clostridiales Family XIII bacterium]|nr:InlB B-repeat-containing protein [Clostridiales Family XIII bacterium]